jgi:hypothetical protein
VTNKVLKKKKEKTRPTSMAPLSTFSK